MSLNKKAIILCIMALLICFLSMNLKEAYLYNADMKEDLIYSKKSLEEIKEIFIKTENDKLKLQDLKEKLDYTVIIENSLNSRISAREKDKEKLLKEKENLSLEIKSLEDKTRPMPYIYFDSVLDGELIDIIIDHFEAIRTHNKDAFIATLSPHSEDRILHHLEYEPAYLTSIRYSWNLHGEEKVKPVNSSFFALVSIDLYSEGYFSIGVNKTDGRWSIHDYD